MSVNPVIIKDLKLKMRNFKTSSLTMRYLLVLGIIELVAFIPQFTNRSSYNSFNPQIVLNTYVLISIVQYIMIVVLTPVIIAEAMRMETEDNALDLILCTSFPSFSIIWGKVIVSITQIFLLAITSLPLMATVFLFGGIRVSSLVLLFVFYLVTSLLIASISLFYSTFINNDNLYKLLTYITGCSLIVVINILLVKVIYLPMLIDNLMEQLKINIPWYFYSNPVYGFGSVIDSNSIPFIGDASEFSGNFIKPVFLGIEIKPWLLNLIVYLIISLLFLSLAAMIINPVKKKLFWKRG